MALNWVVRLEQNCKEIGSSRSGSSQSLNVPLFKAWKELPEPWDWVKHDAVQRQLVARFGFFNGQYF